MTDDGGLKTSFVPEKNIFVQDTAPSSPDEGELWRDTQNNVLKQWDGSSWVSVQTSPDESSIITLPNGSIGVNRPSTKLIGNFEVDKDGFTEFQQPDTNLTTSLVTSNGVTRGNQALEIEHESTTTDYSKSGVEKTINITNADTVKIDLNVEETGTSVQGMGARVKNVDSAVKDSSGSVTLELDVSDASGEEKLQLYGKGYDSGNIAIGQFDNIRLVANNAFRISPEVNT